MNICIHYKSQPRQTKARPCEIAALSPLSVSIFGNSSQVSRFAKIALTQLRRGRFWKASGRRALNLRADRVEAVSGTSEQDRLCHVLPAQLSQNSPRDRR